MNDRTRSLQVTIFLIVVLLGLQFKIEFAVTKELGNATSPTETNKAAADKDAAIANQNSTSFNDSTITRISASTAHTKEMPIPIPIQTASNETTKKTTTTSDVKSAQKATSTRDDAIATTEVSLSAVNESNNSTAAIESTSTDNSSNTVTGNIIDLCFVSSIFGESAAKADIPGDFRNYTATFRSTTNTTSLQFFLYTNLDDLKAPGWTKIVKNFPDYRRFITQSRWGKFMAWTDAETQGCKTIFYFDGHYEPRHATAQPYLEMAALIHESNAGLAQIRHPSRSRTALKEFEMILKAKKDIRSNVDKSIEWLHAQPDFHNNCTLYANFYFGFDPKNENFQKATQFFWEHYSKEEDSWRDQPLWCHTLAHFGLRPIPMRKLFRGNEKRMGRSQHKYGSKSDNDASAAAKKE